MVKGSTVHVIGTGTIGEPLVALLARHRKELGLDEVTFYKHTPRKEDRPMLRILEGLGARLSVAKETKKEFDQLGLRPAFVHEDALARARVVIDCTPEDSGLENKERLYKPLDDGSRRFLAQGSEAGFGKRYALGVNDDAIDDGDRFVHVVSCNTHSIANVIQNAGLRAGGGLEWGHFVCIRRASDVNEEKGIGAPTVDKHGEEHGTHHAEDVHELFKTRGDALDVFSSALKLPTQYMHTLHFHLRTRNTVTRDAVLKAFKEDPYAALTDKRSTNRVFSFGRDHGFFGRILNQTVVCSSTVAAKGDREVVGFAFTPQDGNALLSNVAMAVRTVDPDGWKKRLDPLRAYLFKEV